MRKYRTPTCVLWLTLCGLSACNRSVTIDDARLRGADRDAANWLQYGRTYDDHRYSPLTQINEQTVGKLGLVWSRELNTTRGLEATPLVENGVMYTTGFRSRKLLLGWDNTPMHRWAQAQMFRSLCFLLWEDTVKQPELTSSAVSVGAKKIR